MMRPLVSTLALFAALPAFAEAPMVTTDIAPVHSLTAMVMDGVGEPTLLIEPGASPHHSALRPSQAKALSQADLVIWISEKLTPQVGHQIDVLAKDSHLLTLIDLPGNALMDFRESAVFEDPHHDDHKEDGHDHETHAEEGHDDHAHDDHAKEGHDDHAHDDHAKEGHDDHAHDDHAKEGHHDHDHDHSGLDPHIWLSPENAKLWLKAIALELGKIDPENAETYNQNATLAVERVEEARQRADETLASVRSEPIAVAHDAFQYYDHTFGLNILGAISDTDDAAPGPARLAALQAHFKATTMPTCFLGNPGNDARLIEAAAGGASDFGVAVANPLGTDHPLGKDLYPALITGLAQTIADCVKK